MELQNLNEVISLRETSEAKQAIQNLNEVIKIEKPEDKKKKQNLDEVIHHTHPVGTDPSVSESDIDAKSKKILHELIDREHADEGVTVPEAGVEED